MTTSAVMSNVTVAGVYTFVITDSANGCEASQDFTVVEDIVPPVATGGVQ